MAEIRDREQHEAKFARKMGRLTGKHRRELKELMGHPPDVSRVPEAFWIRVERETEEALLVLLLLIFVLSAEQHGATKDRAEAAAIVWARRRSAEMAAGHRTSGRDMLQTAARDWAESIPTKGQVEDRITKIFGPTRAESFAVSGTTGARTAGGEFGVEETDGLSEDDTWFTQGDDSVCPICEPLHNTPRSVWSLKFPSGPPAHTRGGSSFIDADCRCKIKYANEK